MTSFQRKHTIWRKTDLFVLTEERWYWRKKYDWFFSRLIEHHSLKEMNSC